MRGALLAADSARAVLPAMRARHAAEGANAVFPIVLAPHRHLADVAGTV